MNSTSYQTFAYYYNQLIPQAFYQAYADKIKSFQKFNSILDLACGSGTLCFLLKDDHNEVSGLDLSEEMLMIAFAKNLSLKKGITFVNADMVDEIKLHDNYDLITCTLDSLNYLDSLNKVAEVFSNVAAALQVNGYFFFDVLTQFYVDEIVADYYQGEALAEFDYEWHVKKVGAHQIEHELNIFVGEQCFSEQHDQYIYDEASIEKLLADNKLALISKEYETNELNAQEAARIYYVVRKVG